MDLPSHCWDRLRALDAVGGDEEFLSELAGIFCAACSTLLQNLEDSISAKNLFSAVDAAHLLYCSARSLVGTRVMEAALIVETMARRHEVEGLRNACHALRQEAELLVDELVDFRNKRFEMLREPGSLQT